MRTAYRLAEASHWSLFMVLERRKIRQERKQCKMSLSKKIDCKGTLRQVFLLSEAPSPPMTPNSPPLHTVNVYTGILIHAGKGWGEREG
jgi:hypothetical protein